MKKARQDIELFSEVLIEAFIEVFIETLDSPTLL